jgi:hypothetical protein
MLVKFNCVTLEKNNKSLIKKYLPNQQIINIGKEEEDNKINDFRKKLENNSIKNHNIIKIKPNFSNIFSKMLEEKQQKEEINIENPLYKTESTDFIKSLSKKIDIKKIKKIFKIEENLFATQSVGDKSVGDKSIFDILTKILNKYYIQNIKNITEDVENLQNMKNIIELIKDTIEELGFSYYSDIIYFRYENLFECIKETYETMKLKNQEVEVKIQEFFATIEQYRRETNKKDISTKRFFLEIYKYNQEIELVWNNYLNKNKIPNEISQVFVDHTQKVLFDLFIIKKEDSLYSVLSEIYKTITQSFFLILENLFKQNCLEINNLNTNNWIKNINQCIKDNTLDYLMVFYQIDEKTIEEYKNNKKDIKEIMKILTNLNSEQTQELKELLLKIENRKLKAEDFLNTDIINEFCIIKKEKNEQEKNEQKTQKEMLKFKNQITQNLVKKFLNTNEISSDSFIQTETATETISNNKELKQKPNYEELKQKSNDAIFEALGLNENSDNETNSNDNPKTKKPKTKNTNTKQNNNHKTQNPKTKNTKNNKK